MTDSSERFEELEHQLRAGHGPFMALREESADAIATLRRERDEARAALERIISEAESDDGLSAWDGADIAREALASATPEKPTTEQLDELQFGRVLHKRPDPASGQAEGKELAAEIERHPGENR